MSASQTLEFGAILSISMPDGVGHTDFHVYLASTDLIISQSGELKPLGDCTLAELRQFAVDFEADVWSAYEAMTLFDLVVDGQATISLIQHEDGEPGVVPAELTLEHRIIFPQEKATDPPDSHKDDHRSGELEDDIAAALADIDEAASDSEEKTVDEQAVEPKIEKPISSASGVQELAAALKDLEEIIDAKAVDMAEDRLDETAAEIVEETQEEIEEDEPLPDLAVSKTEPVHLERETAAEAIPTTPQVIEKRPLFRVLGKRRPLNPKTWTAVDILISERAFRAAQVHANSSLDREVAGVLLGPHPEKQPDGRYVVHVSDAIVAKHTRMHGASVTYTPESWRYVNDRLSELYPDDDAVIVGWYHTHPGFGIFLSGMDQFIHQNFFTQIWHIAMVLDPLARRSGFFCWDRRLSKVDKYDFPWPAWASSSW